MGNEKGNLWSRWWIHLMGNWQSGIGWCTRRLTAAEIHSTTTFFPFPVCLFSISISLPPRTLIGNLQAQETFMCVSGGRDTMTFHTQAAAAAVATLKTRQIGKCDNSFDSINRFRFVRLYVLSVLWGNWRIVAVVWLIYDTMRATKTSCGLCAPRSSLCWSNSMINCVAMSWNNVMRHCGMESLIRVKGACKCSRCCCCQTHKSIGKAHRIVHKLLHNPEWFACESCERGKVGMNECSS